MPIIKQENEKQMKKCISKKIFSTITLILMMAIAIPIVALPITPVKAQLAAQQPVSGPLPNGVTVAVQADSASFLSIRPNPIGIGQTFLINMWINPPPNAYRFFADYKLTVTPPNGTAVTYTMDSYVADGTMWMEMVADKVGEWQFKMEFPGCYFPAGRYIDGYITTANTGGQVYAEAAYVKPSSTPVTKLIVQDEPIQAWPASPLPTDYWTRPVNAENREWWSILGNYPWIGPGGGELWNELYPNTNIHMNSGQNFVPWVQVPQSAHVVWKREGALGGIVGGDAGTSSVYWPTTGWGNAPTVILWGKGYQTVMKPSTTGPNGQAYWQCYDIRTGELFWERPLYAGEAEPNLIEYGITAVPPVPGVSFKPDTPYLLSISNGYLRRYNAETGYMINNISIAPMTGTGGTYYMNGHVLGVQDLGVSAGAQRYRLINWTTFDTSTNFAARIVSNTSYARNSLPPDANTDYSAGYGATTTGNSTGGINTGVTVRGFNLYTGQQLWEKYIAEPEYSGAADMADHGKIAVATTRGHYFALDLATGAQVWETEQLDYPYDATGWGSYSTISGYGNLYRIAQTGVYSIDWETGKINWKFEMPMPYQYEGAFTGGAGETVYPYHAPALLADGKLILPTSLHSPESPYYRGLRTFVVDAFTGKEVWSIGMSVAGQHTRSSLQLRVADGYLTIGARDGWMYVIGKGRSATTVTAPLTNIQVGQSATLTGTVLDLSPAQPGTAAISDQDIDAWMEYLHLQMPKPTDAKGVNIKLTAIDPNSNLIDIGQATSDTDGNFGLSWGPEIPGLYHIIATFNGTGSYGSSSASTYLTAIEAPAATPTSQPIQASNTDTYFLPAVAGIITAIFLVGAILAFLQIKKRP